MSNDNLIPVNQLCTHYQVEVSLFSELNDLGIIEMITIKNSYFIHHDKINVVEKVVRMQKDLHINLEGIDTVLNLLDKIDELQIELNSVKNRLRLYKD